MLCVFTDDLPCLNKVYLSTYKTLPLVRYFTLNLNLFNAQALNRDHAAQY